MSKKNRDGHSGSRGFKIPYTTLAAAEDAASRRSEETGQALHAYLCRRLPEHYHIGTIHVRRRHKINLRSHLLDRLHETYRGELNAREIGCIIAENVGGVMGRRYRIEQRARAVWKRLAQAS